MRNQTETVPTPSFKLTSLGQSIFKERYQRHSEEEWEGGANRLGTVMATAEHNGKAEEFGVRFAEQINTGRFMPGGRIWYGAGRAAQQMLNCYVTPTEDTREGWGQTLYDLIVISGTGGGVGMNYSPVRGRGYPIQRMGGHSTGAVSLMQMCDKVGSELVAGGGRRMAIMMCLDINHPDISEFIETKLDLKQLTNANVSVVIPPDLPTEDFVRMIREGENIPLQFSGRTDVLGRTINAKELWDRIVLNSYNSGEPGVLNSHLANKMSNTWYFHPLISTNPCGEIWLPAYGCCDLGALVLPRFVVDGKIDWDMLDESVRLGVRFLDNVLTINHYPLEAIKKVCERERRIGLGVMGLHSMLMDLGMKYESPEAFAFVDKLFDKIKTSAYHASVDLAIEKGPFPAFDKRMLDSAFIKTLKPSLRRRIAEYGTRNCAVLTIAPTGTTAMVQGVTAGIEPIFAPAHIRTRFLHGKKAGKAEMRRTLVISRDYVDHPELAQGAFDISVRGHFEMQKICQRHIDNAVSKTVNLPKDFPMDELSELWLEYLPHLKGSTFYREGSRENEPLQAIPLKDIQKVMDEWTEEKEYEDSFSIECPSGVCTI